MSTELKIMCGVGIAGIVGILLFALLTHPDNIDKPWREPMKLWLRNVGIGILLGLAFGFALGSVRSAKAGDSPDNETKYVFALLGAF
jgi:hypothetical protein